METQRKATKVKYEYNTVIYFQKPSHFWKFPKLLFPSRNFTIIYVLHSLAPHPIKKENGLKVLYKVLPAPPKMD